MAGRTAASAGPRIEPPAAVELGVSTARSRDAGTGRGGAVVDEPGHAFPSVCVARLTTRGARDCRGEPEPGGDSVLQTEELSDGSIESEAADDCPRLDVDETRRDAKLVADALVASTDGPRRIEATTCG